MDCLLYYVALTVVKSIQALPLRAVAWLGRATGQLAYWLDARHRRVAVENLTRCFGHEKSSAQVQALARKNFQRIGENYLCAIKTATMPWEKLKSCVEFVGVETLVLLPDGTVPGSVVVAIGHFGNFELYARLAGVAPAFQCGTTYRGLRQPSLDRLLKSLRERSGCRFFERRSDAAALRAWMEERGRILGLLSDQHAGNSGLRLPFFGQDCSTTAAPAIFALRYQCPLRVAVCFRIAPARWRIEFNAEIPIESNGERRSPEEIMSEVNKTFEAAIRRDPANWFWVHKRWKPAPNQTPGSPGQKAQPDNVAGSGTSQPEE